MTQIGRLSLTASAFNQLGQYTSSPGAGATATQNSPFFFPGGSRK